MEMYKCDKCKKSASIYNEELPAFKLNIEQDWRYETKLFSKSSVDLCEKCGKELKKWLKRRK